MERDPAWYLRDTRNIIWGQGVVAILYALLMVVVAITEGADKVKWDVTTVGVTVWFLLLAGLSVAAGIRIGRGEKSGIPLAYIPACFMLLLFPIGTIFAVMIFVRLQKKMILDQLK